MASAANEMPRVYIVDGDDDVRWQYRRLLQPLGYRIEDFREAASFLAAADTGAAGCVVLDVRLPGLSGADLHERLRATCSPLAIVFATAHDDVPSAVSSMQRGAAHYLLKPVREQQLLDVVNQALRKSTADAAKARARHSVLAHLALLTAREQQVLKRLIDGVHYDRVASELGITKRTVEAHRRRIMQKMGARTLPQLLLQLTHVGWPSKQPAQDEPPR